MSNRSPGYRRECPDRLYFVDNIRWAIIVLVVMIHLNVTYGNFGRWYYVEERKLDLFSGIFFATFGSSTQAFMMGLLFLVAGHFVPGYYHGKGPERFAIERLVRLRSGYQPSSTCSCCSPCCGSSWQCSTSV